jgi:hypothetical protein
MISRAKRFISITMMDNKGIILDNKGNENDTHRVHEPERQYSGFIKSGFD